MSIVIEPYAYFGTNEFIVEAGQSPIRLIAYRARYGGGTIRLVDHDAYEWVREDEMRSYRFAPADVKFVEMLLGG